MAECLATQVRNLESENRSLKQEVGALREVLGKNPEKKPHNCKHCKYFNQYYGKIGSNYHPVYSGYCVCGRRFKKKTPDDECEYFEPLYIGENFI